MARVWHHWDWEAWRVHHRVPPREPLALPEPEREALDTFEVASAELLASRSLLKRTDTKFVFPRVFAGRLLEALRPDFSVVLSRESPIAHYRTLYFDDEALFFFRQHRRGRRARHKVRVREYLEREVAYLEVKTKDHHEVTSKVRVRRPPGDFELRDEDRAKTAEIVGEVAHRLQPSLWVDFPRVTLVGREVHERITLDLGLELTADNEHLVLPDLAVAEIKQPRFGPRTPGMLAIRSQRVHPKAFSKYCVAVSLTLKDPRTHRIAPRLREVVRLHDAG